VAAWHADFVMDEALARRLIAGQFFEPRTLTLIGEGWDNTVWLADERWAFRFPRRESASPGVTREIEVLSELELPVATPFPRFVGTPADGYPCPFFGFELILGTEPLGLTMDDRRALWRPLGAFLRALHDQDVSVDLPQDPMGRADMRRRVPKTLEALLQLGWEVPGWLREARHLQTPAPTALVHGDLHFRHVLVDPRGWLAGVIDWGDVCRADPCIDLPLVWSFLPPDGRAAFFEAYGSVSEEQLRRARVLAIFLCATLAVYAQAEGLDAIDLEARIGYELAAN
jgi:aminoglycoside phosphotransferase (APT) family kinase protein